MRHWMPLAIAAIALSIASLADAAGWSMTDEASPPQLNFGTTPAAAPKVSLRCDQGGTRLAVAVRRVPRSMPADADSFATFLTLFFGRREWFLPATGRPVVDSRRQTRTALIEAPLPDPDAFFTALATQGRLVVVTFAGRTQAPAPAFDMVAAFQARCPARG